LKAINNKAGAHMAKHQSVHGNNTTSMMELIDRQSYFAVGTDNDIRHALFSSTWIKAPVDNIIQGQYHKWKAFMVNHKGCLDVPPGTVFFADDQPYMLCHTAADGKCCY